MSTNQAVAATDPKLLLFGDQTVEKLTSIRALVCYSKTCAAAQRLLREATDLLQLELAALSKEDRSWTNSTHSLLGLAEDNVANEKTNGVIATVLMCIGRLGALVKYAEDDPSILGSEQAPVHVLAFCTGLLPAAVLVAARDTSELVQLGIQIISITFRMAHEIIRRMKLIEDSPRSWAVTVLGKLPGPTQQILDAFHRSCVVPALKRVAIGVVSSGWLTLVAAPSTLDRLMKFSKELDDAPKITMDTNGAVHTEYMPTLDLDYVLGQSPLLDRPITAKARLLSPSTCQPYPSTTLRSLLSKILPDIAHNTLRIYDTAEACITSLAGRGPVTLITAGPTGHLPVVQNVLRAKAIQFHIREPQLPILEGQFVRGGSDQIAIVGMAARLPGSDTVEDFFENLLQSKLLQQRIPKARFRLEDHYDATGNKRNTTSAQYGAFLERPGYFDHRLFRISPREAAQMDPLQRLLLTTSYEALEHAGYHINGTAATQSDRIAVYFGQAAEDWRDILNNEDIDIYYVPSLSRPFGPSRVAYHHGWAGGTFALDAACATSTTTIHLACSALKARECDTALAGGGSLAVSPYTFSGLSRSGMIADGGGCRTYHDDADGYMRGEGVGVVVLKRLEDAMADNDNILGVIRGSARTYTNTSTSITHPSAESQARIYKEVLRQSNVSADEIAYVEMHGTGTQAGDFEEVTSVVQVLGQGRSKDNRLTVGAVKANVGHGEGAAGITSLIKVLMMLRERKIPPQPALPFQLNHRFPPLNRLHVRIAGLSGQDDATLCASPASQNQTIKCMVNSFDASGGNTSLLIEEPPARRPKSACSLPIYVVSISAKTTISLQQNTRRLLDYMTRNPDVRIADLAYSTTARRMHEAFRVAYTARSTRALIASLRAATSNPASTSTRSKPSSMRVVFAFTGQGSQYVGMGKQLYQHSAALRALLQTYQQITDHQGLPSFLHLITDDGSTIDDASAISIQLATVALEIAVAQLFKTWNIKPDVLIGHSLGEYSALCVAGVLSVSDTLFLVGSRARLMEKQLAPAQYTMLAVSEAAEAVEQRLQQQQKIQIACRNAPNLTVVSGPTGEIDTLKAQLASSNVRATAVNVSYGFHSSHMDPILDEFEALAAGITFNAPATAIASTLEGKMVEPAITGIFGPSYLRRQARETVNFTGALNALQEHGQSKHRTHFLEIGPEPVCIGLTQRTLNIAPSQLLATMRSSEDNWTTLCSALATLHESGAAVDWPQYYTEFKDSLSLLHLPFYAFDESDFWTPFVERAGPAVSLNVDATFHKDEKALAPPLFSTTSLQRVETEVVESDTATVIFASRVADPDLFKVFQGHVVNGVPIGSLSIFCDMAKTAARYTYGKLKSAANPPPMTLRHIDMTHGLIVSRPDPNQVLKTVAVLSKKPDVAHIRFSSEQGGKVVEHGSCQVVFEDNAPWFVEQDQTSFLVSTRIDALKDMATTGKAHRLLKRVIYQLFSRSVSYSEPYQGMEEVWVDAECRDAVATVKMPKTSVGSNFHFNPFWTDAAIHLAGFVVNSGLKYPEDVICISAGFESWHVREELQADKQYTAYVSMLETETPGLLSGTAYVYNDKHRLVQVTTKIRFQKMKRAAFDAIFGQNIPATNHYTEGLDKRHVPGFERLPRDPMLTPPTDVGDNKPADTADKSSGLDYSFPTVPALVAGHEIGNKVPKVDLFGTLLKVIASEVRLDVSNMDPNTAFNDLGMDSLMSITTLAAFQKATGVELPATLFLNRPTVADLRAAFADGFEELSDPGIADDTTVDPFIVVPETMHVSAAPSSDPSELTTPPDQSKDSLELSCPPAPITIDRESKAVLLQGSGSDAGPKLFLFPDGTGSPSRYIQVPPLGPNVAVYALESPFLKAPKEYTCGVDAMREAFMAAIRRTQPVGPYYLGGFSLGAVYAYDVANRLLRGGEQVELLVIISMAVPAALNTPVGTPSPTQLKDAGLLPAGHLTPAAKEHICQTVRAISQYTLVPYAAGKHPKKTVLLSAKTGLSSNEQMPLAHWAQINNAAVVQGWEKMVGSAVDIHHVDAEQPMMFRSPAVLAVGKILSDIIINV